MDEEKFHDKRNKLILILKVKKSDKIVMKDILFSFGDLSELLNISSEVKWTLHLMFITIIRHMVGRQNFLPEFFSTDVQ